MSHLFHSNGLESLRRMAGRDLPSNESQGSKYLDEDRLPIEGFRE